jgi:putative transposase
LQHAVNLHKPVVSHRFQHETTNPLIANAFQEELYRYIGGIIRAEGGVQLEIGGIADHIHILVKCKPAISLSTLLGKIKANSSKWVNDHKMQMRKFGWQEGYAAFSVSQSQAPVVMRYIRNQETHHRKQSFQEEFLGLLKRHRIECDPRFLWD